MPRFLTRVRMDFDTNYWNLSFTKFAFEHAEFKMLLTDPTSPSQRRSVLGVHWKNWYWSWNSNTLATSWEELTCWERPWCWEGLGAGGEGDDRGWDGWMASLTWWTWVWVYSGSWWWTGRPGVLRFMGLQRIRHDWVTELNWIAFTLILGPNIPGSYAILLSTASDLASVASHQWMKHQWWKQSLIRELLIDLTCCN